MTTEEALDTLAVAALVSALKNPESGGEFGTMLRDRGVSFTRTAQVMRRMVAFGERIEGDRVEDAIGTLAGAAR